MRTKTLLLAAATLAVGIGASVAQTVYSVNAVGYVNITLKPNYNLISNPLNGTNNNLNTIIPVAPDNSQAIRWNPATQSFLGSDTWIDFGNPADNGWHDFTFTKTATTIAPGEAFFILNAASTDYVITFVGEVPQGNLTNTIPANYSFKSSIVPQSTDILGVGFPRVDNLQYFTWNATAQAYTGSFTYFDLDGTVDDLFYDFAFNPVVVAPGVGQGFVIYNPGPTQQWGRTFSVN